MSRELWLDPGFGASGDMVLGALLGLGADPGSERAVTVDQVRSDLAGLDIAGWTLELAPVQRAGISATRALVDDQADHDHDHSHGGHGARPHRSWSNIDRRLADADLPEPVKAGSRATFELLARVEADIHRIDVDQVEFHEVGAVDAIVDIVGAWAALHRLGVDRVASGPVGVGNGVVDAAHGRLPAPAPATVALLRGALIRPVEWASETVTPTGAALLATMVGRWGPVPAGRLVASSRGAGGRDPASHPNVLGALMVETGPGPDDRTQRAGSPDPGARTETALVLATNLDDATPEIIGHTITRALEAGADDAWALPVVMKKNRPGHELRILCRPSLGPTMEALLFAETGTLGLRRELVAKQVLDRTTRTVEVRGHEVRVKAGPYGAKPEYDDLAALSRRTGVPLRQLAREALAADSGPPT